MFRTYITIGGILGMLSVALGAFGAHTLERFLSEQALDTYHTGVEYQMIHAIALVLTAVLSSHSAIDSRRINWAGVLFTAGVVLFSGSLYAVSLTGIGSFGMIAPFGGFSFILGWLMLVLSIWPAKKQRS